MFAGQKNMTVIKFEKNEIKLIKIYPMQSKQQQLIFEKQVADSSQTKGEWQETFNQKLFNYIDD